MAKKKSAAKKKVAVTKTIGLSMNKEMADEIGKRASSMHLSASKYVRLILADWLDSGSRLTLEEH